MENASKALIIAGAILLSIAIIGIGMTVFNMASESINGANMNEQKIAAQNAKISSYEGAQTGTQVRALCEQVRLINSNADNDESKIEIKEGDAATDPADNVTGTETTAITTLKNKISSGKRYTVSFGYTSAGLIRSIAIK